MVGAIRIVIGSGCLKMISSRLWVPAYRSVPVIYALQGPGVADIMVFCKLPKTIWIYDNLEYTYIIS